MPTKVKISKDKILETAFEIAKEQGIENISNRELAKRMNSSIRPIYYQFKNVDELNEALYTKIEKYFYDFLLDNKVEEIPPYKQVGINYIKFAKKEKKLFQTLFMNNNLKLNNLTSIDNKDYLKLLKLIKQNTKINEKDIKTFHTKMWIFTHGIATLVASEAVKLSDKEINELLTQEFQALMLFEEKIKEGDK